MAIRAYVLMETDTAITQETVAEVRRIEGVKVADSVTGPYDIVLTAEVDTIDKMALLLRQIRSASGVNKTTTLIRLG